MKKIICFIVLITMCLGVFSGCGKENGSETITLKALELLDINYENTALEMEESADVRVSISSKVKTGEEITAAVATNIAADKYNYFLVDWGDGTWSHQGPYAQKIMGNVPHVYKQAGTYSVRAACINLSSGELFGWSKATEVIVSGDTFHSEYITKVRAISSSELDADHSCDKIADNNNATYWKSQKAKDALTEEWVGFEFDTYYCLDTIEFKVPKEAEIWPSNFAVEYTTDRGENWYSLPKYYYQYDYSKADATSIMGYPNPKGATIVLNLDGIVANGIRVVSKLFPLDNLKADKYLQIAEMRVSGDERSLFYTSMGGSFDADLNNMWTIFGTAETEPAVSGSLAGPNPDPYRSGCATITSTEWLEWDGLQQIWRDDNEAVMELYDMTLFEAVMGEDGYGNTGYIWATKDGPQHLDVQNHYVYNSIFILAARNYLFTANNTEDFFERTNKRGQTMEERIDGAMEYMLTVMEGDTGVLTITDPRNDGTPNGVASNYWDAMKAFGYKSSYENIYFYRSLLAMADIKEYQGETEEAKKFLALAEKTKKAFNETFWDSDKGRYITSINIEGKRLDFGVTYVNFMAAEAGLTDAEQAKLIYDWIDGKRIIEGDTSTGEDIYGKFKYAARGNTLDVSSTGAPYYWWDHGGLLPCTPGTFGGYGNQMQNGGTIFYISYYDLMGRIKNLGVDNAMERLNVILEEFHNSDSLRVFPYTVHGGYVSGVIGEFPESGLVPLTYVTGILGINPDEQGLKISSNLPKDMDYAGIREYKFADRVYSIKINKDAKNPMAQEVDGVWFVELPADETWIITPENTLIKAE